jgi:Raf kinase inhibitor-like YbhB/YbcL family protein
MLRQLCCGEYLFNPMKKVIIFFVIIFLLGAGVFYYLQNQKQAAWEILNTSSTINNANPMKILSPKFKDNENIPKDYTCQGVNVNPPLEIKDVPKNSQTLALIMDDPDATSGIWVHWLIWNINPNTAGIAENSAALEGAFLGKTSSGQNNYSGPCPPLGMHHYHFKLYALDAKLDLPTYSEKADLEKAMNGHIIEEAELVGLFSR